MNCQELLSVAGIILNTVGSVLVFIFCLSPYVGTDGFLAVGLSDEIDDKNSKMNKKKVHYRIMAITGIILCAEGGLLQMLSYLF
ncbi:hypothetical protein Barb6_01977 [Bacteroidales bacterium Barb6]|nr:hypothetical protein Barb6_01977 [Bacteroidales bacterium Barb6]